MELRSKLAAALLVPVLAVGLIPAFGVSAAYAEDDISVTSTQDYDVRFYFDFYGDYYRTMTASKDDDSASYVFAWENATDGVFLYVDSYSSYYGFVNQTVGGYAYLGTRQGKFAIHQNVYENGFRLASLRGVSNSAGHLYGDWSADSWGTYTDLN